MKVLGLGTNKTLHGTPDARVRGFAHHYPVEVINAADDESESEEEKSDGASLNIEGKRGKIFKTNSTSFKAGYLPQLVGLNVTSAFTEGNIHPKLVPMVPVLLLAQNYARVSVYESASDILLVSNPVYFSTYFSFHSPICPRSHQNHW